MTMHPYQRWCLPIGTFVCLVVGYGISVSYIYNSTAMRDSMMHIPKKNNMLKYLDGNICEWPPAFLHGREPLNRTEYLVEDLNKIYTYMNNGHYKPDNCTPVQKVAIVVPYRNREKQLRIFLNNVIPKIYRQQLEFGIYIIDQTTSSSFNRGMLSNIGFVESGLDMHYDCLVIHDVDVLPEDDRNFYVCRSDPIHMSTLVEQFEYVLIGNAGGITTVRNDIFKHLNGFSNLFFGWGGEDDDLQGRIERSGYKLTRPFHKYGHCGSIAHNKSAVGEDRKKMKMISKKIWKNDGLNTLTYELISKTRNQLFTRIVVDINMTVIRKNFYLPNLQKNQIIKTEECDQLYDIFFFKN